LHVTNSEFTDPSKVQRLIDVFEEKSTTYSIVESQRNSSTDLQKKTKPHAGTQLLVLLRRHLKLSLLDPALYTGRMAAFLLTGLLLSAVYFYTRERTLNLAIERVIMEGWFFAIPSLLTIVHVYQMNTEMKNIIHEVRLGYVNLIPYITAKLLIEIPFMVVLSLATLGPGFVIVDFNAGSFGHMILLFSSMLFAFEALAQAAALGIYNPTYAMLTYVLLWFTAFLFSEIWIKSEYVTLPLRLLFYASPFRLSLQSFVYLDFHDTMFTCESGISLFSAIAFINECVGTYSGDKVLDMIGQYVFPIFTSDVNVGWGLGSTLIIAVVFKAIFILAIARRTSKHSALVVHHDNESRSTSVYCHLQVLVAVSIVGFVTGLSIWSSGENSALVGSDECLLAFKRIGFDLRDHNNYNNFFDQDSVMTLSEAGSYYGGDGILEYVIFAFDSPYTKATISRIDTSFKSYDDKTNECNFRQVGVAKYTPDWTTTSNQVNEFHTAVMINLKLDYTKEKVSEANVYYSKEFLSHYFGKLLNSDATRHFVCSVVNGPCGMQVDNCEASLSKLPIVTGNSYVDGNSQGCRALHAVFAAVNSKHCAHISFEPKNDTNGKVKCQQSKGILPEDLFGPDDFASFYEFQVEVGISPDIGYKETEVHSDNVCSRQEKYIRNQSLISDERSKLDDLYDADLFEYAGDIRCFMKFRSHLCGGKTRNFASLGRLIIGDYDQVIGLISSENQIRGPYIGAMRMREDRVRPFLSLTISDGDVHASVRMALIDHIILPAQERIKSDASVGVLLEKYVKAFVTSASLIGKGLNPIPLRHTIDTFAIRWIMKAVFDLDIDDGVVDLMKYLFRGNIQDSFFSYHVEPFATKTTSDEQAQDLVNAFERLGLIIQDSSPLLAYDHQRGNASMTKKDFSLMLGELIGANVIALGIMIESMFEFIPDDHFINHTDPIEVESAVLELARLRAPVDHVTTLLSKEAVFNVGGENKTFPAGTAVSSNLALANWDSNIFVDPMKFNHTRFNLRSHTVSFAYQGYNPSKMPRRSCPGKNIAMKAGSDVLTALLEMKHSG